jgi:hypothetical protein
MTIALTYETLAERLGINIASARRLALRRRWQKGKGNDGRAIVQVPEDFLQCRDDSRTDHHSGSRTDAAETVAPLAPETALVSDLLTRLAAAQDEIVAMAHKLGAAETEIATLKSQADEVRASVATLTEKASRADVLQAMFDAETKRADEWKAAATARRGWWPFRRKA